MRLDRIVACIVTVIIMCVSAAWGAFLLEGTIWLARELAE
jgi:hypothetical protein